MPKKIAIAITMLAAVFTAAVAAIALSPGTASVAESGKAAIGGSFSLVDQHGQNFTDADLHGHYSLVFFGFAHCPDMCPTALSTMTNALDATPENISKEIIPVFITVDPERDTPEALAEYAKSFHPRLFTLTGTKAQTEQAAKAFKVYHQVADPSVKDYMVNHSGYIYLMDREGNYLTHFSHNVAPEDMAARMTEAVK